MPSDAKTNPSRPAPGARPFPLSDRQFDQIRHLVKTHTGISLGGHKRELAVNRLSRRLRALGLASFAEYLDLLAGPGAGDELIHMINQITTNKTSFFREPHHFEYLADTVLPALEEQGQARGRRVVRIWSAGCSSGEEPYTLALVLSEYFASRRGWNLKILATDLDTAMLETASRGVYPQSITQTVPDHLLRRYFTSQREGEALTFQVRPQLRDLILFRKFNLMRPAYPIRTPLDVIFCRNVMIYFENDDKVEIVTKFHHLLKPGGHLFVGHSESLMTLKHLFARQTSTIYRKV